MFHVSKEKQNGRFSESKRENTMKLIYFAIASVPLIWSVLTRLLCLSLHPSLPLPSPPCLLLTLYPPSLQTETLDWLDLMEDDVEGVWGGVNGVLNNGDDWL